MATERAHQRVGPIAPHSTGIKFGVDFMDALLTGPRSIPPYTGAAIMAIILGGLNRDEKGSDASQGSGAAVGRSDPIYSFFVVFYSRDRAVGNYGPFHSLSVLAIFCTGPGAYFAWSGNIKRHLWRCPLYGVVLVIAGFFTLLPGRAMH